MRQPSATADPARPSVPPAPRPRRGFPDRARRRAGAAHACRPRAGAQSPAGRVAPAPKSQSATKTITIIRRPRHRGQDRGARRTRPRREGVGDARRLRRTTRTLRGRRAPANRGIIIGKHGQRPDRRPREGTASSTPSAISSTTSPRSRRWWSRSSPSSSFRRCSSIGLILWYRLRKARMLNETMLKLAEKGVVTSGDALEALAGGKPRPVLADPPLPRRRSTSRRSRSAGAPRGRTCARV